MTPDLHHGRFGHRLRSQCIICLLVTLAVDVSSAQNVIQVDDFGAAGDGVTWDHNAIQAAISGAGSGGTIVFTQGKTYVVCKRIALSPGLRIVGNGATIRRCKRVNTVLTAPALAGDTSLIVEDASRYELGMWVAPISSGTHDGGEFASRGNRNIQSIDGNVIRISHPLRQSYPAGSLVMTIDEIMIGVRNDVRIEGLIFDGNRRNNDDWVAWENGVSLYLHGERNVIRNNIFLDCWSTCIDYFGGPANIENNYFQGAASAALHVSSIDSLYFSGNQISDTNTLTAEAGHSEASVTWSAFNKGLHFANNCIYNSGSGVFGSVNRKWNNDILIEHNYACGAKSFFTMYKDQPAHEAYAHDGHVIVRDNVAVNVGRSSTSFGGSAASSSELMRNFSFSGNAIVNGYLNFEGLENSLIEENRIWMLDEAAYGGMTSGASVDRAGLITLSESRVVSVGGNRLFGGSRGIYLHNNDGFVLDSISVTSNLVAGTHGYGILTGNLTWLLETGVNAWKADHSGVRVNDNLVISNVMDSEMNAGLITGFGVVSSDNCIDVSSVGARIAGSTVQSGAGNSETFHHGNTYAGSSSGVEPAAIDHVAGMSLVDNVTSHPIPGEFAAAGSELVNNVVDDSATCNMPELEPMPQCLPCALVTPPSQGGILLEIKVLLEGAYADDGLMSVSEGFRNALSAHAVFQPYGQSHFSQGPMAYWGSEFAYPSFPSGSIDWVIVALRTDASAGSEVVRIAAILTENGSLVRPDGRNGVHFSATPPDSYNVVVYHRNHLPIMSSSPVDFESGFGAWDFSQDASKIYGSGWVQLDDGFYGLAAGDANGDGQVTAPDFNLWLGNTTSGTTGYVVSDHNLDGQSTAPDFNIWMKNTTAGKQSSVPE